jgi:streptomycin 6-kinase
MMDLPASFTTTITNTFREEGRRWLADLPSLIEDAARRWDLTAIQPVGNLSYNFVAFASRGKAEVVLKIGVPNREFISEMTALRIFNEDGAVRLLEANPGKYMFLLERLRPGEMLATLTDDDRCTHIACDVMAHLWRPVPEDRPERSSLIKLSEWFGELKQLRVRYKGGTGPFPQALVGRAESLIPALFAGSSPPVLLHGDFHHFNVLSSERGWLVIDPKGVIGPPEYEVGPLLLNPWDDFLKKPDAVRIIERRIAILSERLGFPRERLRDWGLCHAILSAWWDLTEEGTGGEYSLGCAEVIAKAKL